MSSLNEAKKIKTIFMGTPEFACPGFEALIKNSSFELVGVFTQPDKPVGRKQILSSPPVKNLALKYQLPIFQPEKIKNQTEIIKNLEPDLIVVIAYGKIIPPDILNIPLYGCINVHASLLPKYRGAACLNAPILNGDAETGITIMKMDAGLDTGPIIKQVKIALSDRETLEELHDKLANLGAQVLPTTIKDFIEGKIKPTAQTDEQASYVKMLAKKDGQINWQKSAREIERMIRGLNPWPGTYGLTKENKILKILAVKNKVGVDDSTTKNYQPGQFFLAGNELAIKCGQDYLIILELQIEGGKALDAKTFLSGHQNLLGEVLH